MGRKSEREWSCAKNHLSLTTNCAHDSPVLSDIMFGEHICYLKYLGGYRFK